MMLRKSDGFTLIEITCVVVVLGILAIFSLRFLNNAVITYGLITEQERLFSEGSYIMERLTRELTDATTVDFPASGSNAEKIVFTSSTHSNPPHPQERIGKTITYDKSGSLLRWNNGGSNYIIGRNVKTFSIKNVGDGTVYIELIVFSANNTNVPEFKLVTTIYPSNYHSGNYIERGFYGDYYENVN